MWPSLVSGCREKIQPELELSGFSVLVQDEGRLGAVHAWGHRLTCAHTEHGPGGEQPGHLVAGRRLPQLLRVLVDAVVVNHLDAGGTGPGQ